MKRKVWRILAYGFIVLSVIFLYLYFSGGLHAVDSKYKNDAIRDVVVSETEDPLNRVIDFDKLKSINKDVVGWVYVPGTKIDYPILIGSKDDTYLNTDIEGKYNPLGSIFSYAKTKRDLSDGHVMLFGHNMRQQQMFGQLKKFVNDDEFRKNHKKFYVYTEKKTMEFDIISIFITDENNDFFTTGIELGTANFVNFVTKLLERNKFSDYSLQDSSFKLSDNQVFSLVTCYGSPGTPDRLVVSGSVIRERYIID